MSHLPITALLIAASATTYAADGLFTAQIKPILEARCVECHGPNKTKAGLRLDSPAGIMKGTKQGVAVVVPGEPDKSSLYTLTTLPEGHDDIMPSKGKPLTREQTDLIKRWIAEGATFDGAVAPAKR